MYTYKDLLDMEHYFNIANCVECVSLSNYYKPSSLMINIADVKDTGKLEFLSVRR